MQARKSTSQSTIQSIKFGALVLGLSVLLLAVTGQSNAIAASCKQLGKQLASLNNIQSGSPKYKRAVKKQQKYIRQVKRQMRSHNCRRTSLFGSQNAAICGRLKSSLSEMETHIRSLRKKAAGPKVSARSRRRIKRAMRKNGCGIQKAKKKKSERTSILKQAFGKSDNKTKVQKASTYHEDIEKLNESHRSSSQRPRGRRIRAHGKVKTLCVRTCDGYFFPVGFSTEKNNRVPDAEACTNSCPGTEMALYYRKAKNENPKNMFSVDTGKPYTELPTAFAYQKRFNPNCTCNFRLFNREKAENKKSLTVIAGAEKSLGAPSTFTTPVWRVDRGQDPETIANIGGGWTVKSIDQVAPAKEKAAVVETKNRPVRIVGDKFFPGQ